MLHNTKTAWPQKPLSEVADLNPRLDKSAYRDDLEVSFVPMAAVEAGSGRMEVSQMKRFAAVKKGYTPFKEGDVLFAKITPCMENGKMAVVPKLKTDIGFGSTEFHVLRLHDGVDPRYVYHFVSSQSFRREAAQRMTGAVGQKRVPQSFLEQALIPVPLFYEQQRIVAEIEKQFSRLDEAVASLKRVKANLKRYKAAVLKSAVEGKLLEPSSHGTIEVDWETKPISVVIDLLDQGWSPQCESDPSELPSVWGVIKTTAVQPMRYLQSENKRLPDALSARPHLELIAGDVVDFFEITHRRPYCSGGRQIDGSVTVEGTTYLTELKFTKVNDKADNTMGIMVSMSGYSSTAIEQASGRKTPIILLDHSHIYLVLSGSWSLAEVVSRVRRHASQTARAFLPAAEFGG
jgi:hypothetical protein